MLALTVVTDIEGFSVVVGSSIDEEDVVDVVDDTWACEDDACTVDEISVVNEDWYESTGTVAVTDVVAVVDTKDV